MVLQRPGRSIGSVVKVVVDEEEETGEKKPFWGRERGFGAENAIAFPPATYLTP